MKTGAKVMVASWAALSLSACAVGMQYEPSDPESGEEGSITVGAQAGPGGARRTAEVDRNVVPDVGDPQPLELPEIQDYTLDNGLRVVLVERSALPLVSLELQFRGGASAHPAAQAGLAALTADMVDEGTATRSALEIADAVDLLGASLSSTAGYDASQVRLSTLRTHFAEAMGIVADVVMNPAFPEADLERVRQDRLARVIQRSDIPAALADDAFARLLYGEDHPYGAPLLGTRESLEALTRDQVVAFHEARYAPGQATLVVVGDVERAELDSLVAQAFAGWSGHGVDPEPVASAHGAAPGTIYVVDKPGAAQTEVRVGRVALAHDTDEYFPATVANTVLGGSFTSRLNSNLREDKGYTYGARSYFGWRKAPGPFEASAAVATPVTDASVREFVNEITAMGSTDVPPAELDRAKNYLALGFPRFFEAVSDVVSQLSQLVQHDLPVTFFDGFVDGVLAVDAASVRELAASQLDMGGMVIVVAGDREVIEEPLKALGLGPVVVLDGRPVSEQ